MERVIYPGGWVGLAFSCYLFTVSTSDLLLATVGRPSSFMSSCLSLASDYPISCAVGPQCRVDVSVDWRTRRRRAPRHLDDIRRLANSWSTLGWVELRPDDAAWQTTNVLHLHSVPGRRRPRRREKLRRSPHPGTGYSRDIVLEAASRHLFACLGLDSASAALCLGLVSVSRTQCFGLGSASLFLAWPRLGLEVSASILLEEHELVTF